MCGSQFSPAIWLLWVELKLSRLSGQHIYPLWGPLIDPQGLTDFFANRIELKRMLCFPKKLWTGSASKNTPPPSSEPQFYQREKKKRKKDLKSASFPKV